MKIFRTSRHTGGKTIKEVMLTTFVAAGMLSVAAPSQAFFGLNDPLGGAATGALIGGLIGGGKGAGIGALSGMLIGGIRQDDRRRQRRR
jgi:outer membrane lipoprotein SlyB